MTERRAVLVVHRGRPLAHQLAQKCADGLEAGGFVVQTPDEPDINLDESVLRVPEAQAAAGCEIVIVFGGDGSILRGAEMARAHDIPLLGINLGHVGFLAELEEEDADEIVHHVIGREYTIQHRMTLEVEVCRDGGIVGKAWALNEASVEKSSRSRMVNLVAEVDHRPLSRWGCDGVLFATPSGSTGYAWSAGGPVVWPTVQAMMLIPISAHALFARPMVVDADSTMAVEVLGPAPAVLWCDGRRQIDLQVGDRVEVHRSDRDVKLARLRDSLFVDRLVAKFRLPVQGWSGRGSA